MWLWFGFASIVKFFSTAGITEFVALCFLLRERKKKEKKKTNKPVGIKCFCIRKDLDKADVFSVHEDAHSLVKKGEHGCWVGLQGHRLMGYTGKMLESLI